MPLKNMFISLPDLRPVGLMLRGLLVFLFERMTRLYPFYRGRGRLALSAFLREDAPDMNLIRRKLRTGQTIFLYPNDYISRMIRFFGDLDPLITKMVMRNLSAGDTIIDIGANIGAITLPAASVVGASGEVIAIEPNHRASSALRASVAINGFRNIKIVQTALSDYHGQGKLTVPAGSLGQSALTLGEGEAVDVMRLDEIKAGANTHIRMIKIDVEGQEDSVIRGGLSFIRRHNVDLIVFESHHARGKVDTRPEVVLLRELGFEIYQLRRRFWALNRVRKVSNRGIDTSSYDFLAVRAGAAFQS